MFPFWDLVIAPIIEAVGAKRIVEIGALRGDTTVRMLERLGPDTELHVVDPVPDFDPAEHERRFPGRYVLHRDTSHNVLPSLPLVDVALIDGDHNWYTVYHELRMLREAADHAGGPLPLLIMHDVLWPYGRRDLYYAPERIPEEFRQPYDQRGMRPDRPKLLHNGGLNRELFNAVSEGGARNGVMTALDDFLETFDRPVRRLVLPIYYGLAVIVEESWLARAPQLAHVLDHLESGAGKHELLELSESVRIQAMLFQQNVFHHREGLLERAASRYLRLLKAALLDEHYLENEVRLEYLASCIEENRATEELKLRDPVRYLKHETNALRAARESGRSSFLPYTDMGRARLERIEDALERVRMDSVAGDLVECGSGRGGGAIFMRGYLDAREMRDRQVWVADTFHVSRHGESGLFDLSPDLNIVREAFDRFELLDERVHFLQGSFRDTLHDAPIETIALLHLGSGLGEAAGDVLDELYSRVECGGAVLIDDYDTRDCRQAVDRFRTEHGVQEPIQRVDWSGGWWQKSDVAAAITTEAPQTPAATPSRAFVPPPAPTTSKDLSVIVVFFNMRREAARTLHSLSRTYQQGIEELDYEVIVVENGSAPEQKLGQDFVQSFGPEFRYLDLGADATPTPANALNRGIEIASGQSLAFMIDGAHVLTPGILRHGMAGLATYAPAIVATQLWYVGPGQQGDEMSVGYDQTYEDRLFEHIQWPENGYRLFEIGHFIGDRDWLDGLWESNCVFVPRKLLEQVGSFDESFSMPGGGYANLDFYERVGSTPGVNVVTMLGEGSFHQLHGGTTTNQEDASGRRQRIVSYADHYKDIRGRAYKGPAKTIHYVGTMSPAALRTRSRRMSATAFLEARISTGPDGRPTGPSPIPQDFRTDFIDAFWHSLAWRETTWLGKPVYKAPTDLFVYQELLARVRPDWVIETGTVGGGRALFLASICDLLDHGQVVSVDARLPENGPRHPRLSYVEGMPHETETVRKVIEIVGDQPNAMVILGSCGSHMRMIEEFEAYQRMVPAGSYVVMEETIVNGHPVWPGFGGGPMEAVKRILAAHGDFAVDPKMEKYALTFNPLGFLKRTR
jgi:cephalosporin hydroxylase